MTSLKILIEKHADGFIAYPLVLEVWLSARETVTKKR